MWDELLLEAGLNEREVRSIMILGSRPKMKASELAKELNTTRLDAYNSLSRLQEMGIVTATADRPMLFSSLRINEAMEHIIQSRKQQLDRLVDGFDELSKGITETDASYEKQRRDIDAPRFAVLKERTHIKTWPTSLRSAGFCCSASSVSSTFAGALMPSKPSTRRPFGGWWSKSSPTLTGERCAFSKSWTKASMSVIPMSWTPWALFKTKPKSSSTSTSKTIRWVVEKRTLHSSLNRVLFLRRTCTSSTPFGRALFLWQPLVHGSLRIKSTTRCV